MLLTEASDCPPFFPTANLTIGGDSSADMFSLNESPPFRLHIVGVDVFIMDQTQVGYTLGFCAGGRKRPTPTGRRRKSDDGLLRRQTTKSRHSSNRRKGRPRKPRCRLGPGAAGCGLQMWENPVFNSWMAVESCVPFCFLDSGRTRSRHDLEILAQDILIQGGCPVCIGLLHPFRLSFDSLTEENWLDSKHSMMAGAISNVCGSPWLVASINSSKIMTSAASKSNTRGSVFLRVQKGKQRNTNFKGFLILTTPDNP